MRLRSTANAARDKAADVANADPMPATVSASAHNSAVVPRLTPCA